VSTYNIKHIISYVIDVSLTLIIVRSIGPPSVVREFCRMVEAKRLLAQKTSYDYLSRGVVVWKCLLSVICETTGNTDE
jgi:hypothetical protein